LWPVALASAAAIASKTLFRVRTATGSSHFMNPSNFGISLTLLLFPWIGIAPPYQFTEQLDGIGDWALPALIVLSGTFLNWKFTKRVVLVYAWMFGFAAQAFLRYWILDARLEAALAPMTGTAFILFSFYMVSDPATTPSGRRAQVLFGTCTAMTYGLLMASHVVFGLFFSLSLVCCGRGLALWLAAHLLRVPQVAPERTEDPAGLAVASR
jgi:Na+-translocating ferredoxin:NAD+ oxidoreductase RnfD subunit